MVEIKSQKELEAQIAAGAEIKRIDAPTYYSSSMRLTFDSNDCTIVFQKGHPVLIGKPTDAFQAAVLEAVAVVSMSPGAAKDLSILLADRIAAVEETWGVIETDFTRSRAQKPKTRPKRRVDG